MRVISTTKPHILISGFYHPSLNLHRLFTSGTDPVPQTPKKDDPVDGNGDRTNEETRIGERPLRQKAAREAGEGVDVKIGMRKEDPAEGDGEREVGSRRARRGVREAEKVEDVIARMIASRAWTTRLQNSIRRLVPRFEKDVVYNVIDGAVNADHALRFFRWVERAGLFDHDKDTSLKMIERLGRAAKLNHARCIMLDMPGKGVEIDEDVFVVLIDSYGKEGIVQESVKLFQKMKELGVVRTGKSYDAFFKVIFRRGRYMMAKRYFNKMLEEGIEPTLHTYNIMLWGFFLCQRIETANRFYEDMRNRGIMPNVITYNTLINGYHRVKKIEEVEKVFFEMKERNIEPTVISYTTMIKGYSSVCKVDDAVRMFEEMKSYNIKPNATTYTTLLSGHCDAAKMTEAEKVLKEMVESHAAPKDNSIFVRLLYGQCKVGNLDAASHVLKAMIRLSIPTEAGHYGILIENFYKGKQYDRAVNLLDKVIEKELILRPESTLDMEASAYNPMIEYLCSNGHTAKAETLLRQLMKKGVQDPKAFNNLIQGHAKEGKPEAAFEMLKIMIKRGVKTQGNSFVLITKSFLKKGNPTDAKMALDTMIENGHAPDASLYRSVMESLFKDERVQTASRVLKTMLEKGVKENMDLFPKILEALLMRGHVEEALGRIELLIQSGIAPDIDSLLTALSEKGKAVAAVKLLDFALERDLTLDFSSYDKVLSTLLEAGKTLSAYSILCKITEKGGAADKRSCEDLIRTLTQEGNTKQADILSRMIMGGEKGRSSTKRAKQALLAA
ncbi:hypothetical protein Drorol1_Dr00026670 [Drosera rotundifolia]